MTVWLLAFRFTEPGLAGNHYSLAVLNPDPKDDGLSKTQVAEHSFPTIGAVTKFVTTYCKPEEVSISELGNELGEQRIYAMEVSKASAVKMGFKV